MGRDDRDIQHSGLSFHILRVRHLILSPHIFSSRSSLDTATSPCSAAASLIPIPFPARLAKDKHYLSVLPFQHRLPVCCCHCSGIPAFTSHRDNLAQQMIIFLVECSLVNGPLNQGAIWSSSQVSGAEFYISQVELLAYTYPCTITFPETSTSSENFF